MRKKNWCPSFSRSNMSWFPANRARTSMSSCTGDGAKDQNFNSITSYIIRGGKWGWLGTNWIWELLCGYGRTSWVGLGWTLLLFFGVCNANKSFFCKSSEYRFSIWCNQMTQSRFVLWAAVMHWTVVQSGLICNLDRITVLNRTCFITGFSMEYGYEFFLSGFEPLQCNVYSSRCSWLVAKTFKKTFVLHSSSNELQLPPVHTLLEQPEPLDLFLWMSKTPLGAC